MMTPQMAFAVLVLALATGASAEAGDVQDVLHGSMVSKNHVSVDRVQRDELQAFCSKPRGEVAAGETLLRLRQEASASVVLPSDGNYLGDWEKGAEVANNGRGLQYSDSPDIANGGNCYACHQLDPDEVAYGTLGPSLTGYGARGQSQAMLEYTWTKLWNTHAYNVCSHMPRFGAAGILNEAQLKDIMAYLLDPLSPVNRDLQP